MPIKFSSMLVIQLKLYVKCDVLPSQVESLLRGIQIS